MKSGLLFFVISRASKNKNVKVISSMVLLSLTLLLLTHTLYYNVTTYGLPSRGASASSGAHPTHIPNSQINMQRPPNDNTIQPNVIRPNDNTIQPNVIRPNDNTIQPNVIRPTVNCPTVGHPNTPRSTVDRNSNNCNNINGQIIIDSGPSSSSSSLTINSGVGRSSNNFGTPVQMATQYAVPMLVSYPPIANAGYNQIVHSKDYVVLDGTGSYDPYGSPLYYSWTQSPAQYSLVLLSDYNQPKVTFVAPQVTAITNLTFELIVNNGRVNSDPSYTTITIYP
jgi:hypothetical protein